MKAFVLDRYAKKGVLRRAEVPAPSLGDDEVLVEVHAAGVNPLDAKIRDGEFKLILPYKMPLILGLTWRAWWCGWGRACGSSSLAMRSMPGRTTFTLVLLRNSSRSRSLRWPSSPAA